jgi:hypothetical protein
VQPDGTPYIETVSRRGYSFTAAVRETRASEAHSDSAAAAIAVDGERKQATVLHCGVANAAVLAERFLSILRSSWRQFGDVGGNFIEARAAHDARTPLTPCRCFASRRRTMR